MLIRSLFRVEESLRGRRFGIGALSVSGWFPRFLPNWSRDLLLSEAPASSLATPQREFRMEGRSHDALPSYDFRPVRTSVWFNYHGVPSHPKGKTTP
jgi:hypothetical protein